MSMKKELISTLHQNFESVAHTSKKTEFWYARDLQNLLGYTEWRNFIIAIEKAKKACQTSKQHLPDHFVDVNKMVEIGSVTQRQIADIKLSRYACYLIAQNGDPRKPEIAFAQTYFAVQTRKQEIIEQRLAEIERLQAREKLTLSEKQLSTIIFERGIDHQGFGRIRSKGDTALFGGRSTQQMKNKLQIPENKPLADFLPTITIKAKDFANEITTFNVVRDDLRDEPAITQEHVKNSKDVRTLLAKRHIYPETLPPSEDIKKIARKVSAENKKLAKTSKKLKNS